MNNEFLYMQKLAGLITESEYKAKMEELDVTGKVGKSYPAPGTWDVKKVVKNVITASQEAIDPYEDEFTFKLVPGTLTKNSFTVRDGGSKDPKYDGYDVEINDKGEILILGVDKGTTILGNVNDEWWELRNQWIRRIINTDKDEYYLDKK